MKSRETNVKLEVTSYCECRIMELRELTGDEDGHIFTCSIQPLIELFKCSGAKYWMQTGAPNFWEDLKKAICHITAINVNHFFNDKCLCVEVRVSLALAVVR